MPILYLDHMYFIPLDSRYNRNLLYRCVSNFSLQQRQKPIINTLCTLSTTSNRTFLLLRCNLLVIYRKIVTKDSNNTLGGIPYYRCIQWARSRGKLTYRLCAVLLIAHRNTGFEVSAFYCSLLYYFAQMKFGYRFTKMRSDRFQSSRKAFSRRKWNTFSNLL